MSPGGDGSAGKQKWFLEYLLVREGVAALEQTEKQVFAVLSVDSLA